MTATPGPARRRLRLVLGLRGLMVAVLLLGGCLGWVVYRARIRREAVAEIEEAGSDATYDFEEDQGGFTLRIPRGFTPASQLAGKFGSPSTSGPSMPAKLLP